MQATNNKILAAASYSYRNEYKAMEGQNCMGLLILACIWRILLSYVVYLSSWVRAHPTTASKMINSSSHYSYQAKTNKINRQYSVLQRVKNAYDKIINM